MSRLLERGRGMLPERAILTDDPMRVRMLAAHHLEYAKQYSDLRGMTGFIGSYKGVPLVVQAVGYGGAAVVAYLHEMSALYGVKVVLYTGECISRDASVKLREIITVSDAYGISDAADADSLLLRNASLASSNYSIPMRTCTVHTDDLYGTDKLAPCCTDASLIDFATHSLYSYARRRSLAALSILTVSENEASGECVDEAERQSRFHAASRLAFETISIKNVNTF